jgi:hypothetical protein
MRAPRRRRKPWDPNSTTATPTPERAGKSPFGWDVHKHPGEQLSYRNRTALDIAKDQLREDEYTALLQLADLAERALSNVGKSGAFQARGMSGDFRAGMSDEQRQAYVEFEETVALMVDEIFVTTAFALVLGLRKEKTGAPMSLEEFGATLMRWRHEPTAKGGALVALKTTARVVIHARKQWHAGYRAARRHAAGQREAFEHGRKVERLEQAEREQRKQAMVAAVEAHFARRRTA